MDRMNGKCVEYYSSGKIKKEGVFENGYLIKGRYCLYDGYCYVQSVLPKRETLPDCYLQT